ncbi:hypothetical protein, partial [Streptomyces violascens]
MSDTVSRRSALRLLGGAVTVAAAATGTLAAPARALSAPPASRRVEALIARLSPDEKVGLLHGADD